MSDTDAAHAAADSPLQAVVHAAELLIQALGARIGRIGDAGADLAGFAARLAAQELSIGILLAMTAAVAGVVILTHATIRKLVGVRPSIWATNIWPLLFALSLGIATTRFLTPEPGPVRAALQGWALLAALAVVVRPVCNHLVVGEALGHVARRLRVFSDGIAFALVWALVGVGVQTTLRQWQVGEGLRDLIGTFFLSLPVWLILLWNYNRHAPALVYAIAGPQPRSFARWRAAKMWPAAAVIFLVAALLLMQLSITVGRSLPPVAFLLTLVLVLLAPHIDTLLASWAAKGLAQTRLPVTIVAMRRTVRPAFLTLCVTTVTAVWASPIAIATGFSFAGLAKPAIEVAGIVFITAFLWNLLGVATDRVLADDLAALGRSGDDHDAAPLSRLST
ncbi:MAG: hypothetical protein ACRC7C_14210, partial [Beijerinckiaceae bacterium]